MKNRYMGVFILSLFLATGCAAVKKTSFISKEKLSNQDHVEYVSDIVVNREGYHFLWFIPFASASEDKVKETMEEEVKKKFPKASGVYEFTKIQSRGVSLFDWKPTATYIGKVIRPHVKPEVIESTSQDEEMRWK